jgi:hypothetical protein
MTIYLVIIILVIIFFYVTNNFILKKSYEKFEKMEDGLLCGKENDICRINEYGESSCCKNYRCIRPDGNFQYKICTNKNNIQLNMNFPKIKPIDIGNNIPMFKKDFWTNMFEFCPERKKILEKIKQEKNIKKKNNGFFHYDSLFPDNKLFEEQIHYDSLLPNNKFFEEQIHYDSLLPNNKPSEEQNIKENNNKPLEEQNNIFFNNKLFEEQNNIFNNFF